MKKNISAALLSLACFSAASAAAFADGPVGRAINGVGRAGEDIVDGAGDAVSDVVDGVTGDGADDDTASDDTALDPGGSDEPADDPSAPADSDSVSSEPVSSEPVSSDTSADSPAASIENSGAVGGINTSNPGTGVTYGLTAGAAVLAAVGVVAASARKRK